MSQAGQPDTPSEGLRRLETWARVVFGGCAGIYLLATASEAYAGPAKLLDAIAAWPTHVWVALGVGLMGILVPVSPLRTHVPLRIGGLVLVAGTAMWVGAGVAIALLYSFLMSGFD